VLDLLRSVSDQSYYAVATAAEAELLLGDVAAARASLRRAADRHHGDFGAVGTTRRQLRLICEIHGLDTDLLSELRVPAVAHFCGHRIAADGLATRFRATSEQIVAARVAEVVTGESIGFAYGSLAAGADILWAEALLDVGSEVHVVLPFALAEFVRVSVEPSGAGWTERFHRCLARATSVHYATEDAFLGDDVLFRYCSELGMGLALLRARYLDAEVHQLAVWDGEPPEGIAGTAVDIATWRRHARAVTVVSPTPDGRTYSLAGSGDGQPGPESQSVAHRDGPRVSPRVVRAMLFADVKGFSRLTDELLPVFADSFLGAFAATVDRYQGDVWHRNTWGDALYVVLTDARVAASCALDLQEAVAAIDLGPLGLPADLALRLGGHVGPVFPTHDPVLDSLAFMGSHVSRTARVEPVTPPAVVYVTEAFAAALVLEGDSEFACEYVGRMPAAKDYGELRMYRLRRRASLLR
jgi:class 3 adenylate cyclase